MVLLTIQVINEGYMWPRLRPGVGLDGFGPAKCLGTIKARPNRPLAHSLIHPSFDFTNHPNSFQNVQAGKTLLLFSESL